VGFSSAVHPLIVKKVSAIMAKIQRIVGSISC
jgi:hypothetical protein